MPSWIVYALWGAGTFVVFVAVGLALGLLSTCNTRARFDLRTVVMAELARASYYTHGRCGDREWIITRALVRGLGNLEDITDAANRALYDVACEQKFNRWISVEDGREHSAPSQPPQSRSVPGLGTRRRT